MKLFWNYKNQMKKLDVIKNMLKKLGFNNVGNSISVEKDDFLANKESCILKCPIFIDKNIKLLFDVKPYKDKSNKNFIGYVNTLLANYGIKIKAKSCGKKGLNIKYSIRKTIINIK